MEWNADSARETVEPRGGAGGEPSGWRDGADVDLVRVDGSRCWSHP